MVRAGGGLGCRLSKFEEGCHLNPRRPTLFGDPYPPIYSIYLLLPEFSAAFLPNSNPSLLFQTFCLHAMRGLQGKRESLCTITRVWKCPSLLWPHPKPLALSLRFLSLDVTLEGLTSMVFFYMQYTHSVFKVQLKHQFLACVLIPRQKQSLLFLKNTLCVPLIEHLVH